MKKFVNMKKIRILNLGCGKRKFFSGRSKYQGIDISEMIRKEVDIPDGIEVKEIGTDINLKSYADVIHNADHIPYPFKDSSFDKIVAVHIMEHLWDAIKTLNELHRICKKDGKIYIRVPHQSGNAAWGNPDHKKSFGAGIKLFINSEMCDKFLVKKLEMHYFTIYDSSTSLLKKIFARLIDGLANLNIKLCDRIWCYWVGGFNEIYLVLKVCK